MVRRIIPLILAMSVAGCQEDRTRTALPPEPPEPPSDELPDLPAYPFDFDAETPGGMMIETQGHPLPALEEIDTWFNEAQQCVADWYAVLYPEQTFEFLLPPPVVIVDDTRSLCGNGDTGVYCKGYIIPFIGLHADWAQYGYKWKHEAIHYILDGNGFDDKRNRNHEPAEIWRCEFQ